jgi:hypothetical protein
LVRPPCDEEALFQLAKKRLAADERNALRNEWTAWAREWYGKIAAAAQAHGPVPEFKAAPME